MTGAPDDLDLHAVQDPATPPQQLADIAARRYDLHAIIAVHPQAYPELRTWMGQVDPSGAQARSAAQSASALPPYASTAYAASAGTGQSYGTPVKPRRRGIGWIFAGCGCLVVVAGIVIVTLVIIGLGASGAGGSGGAGGSDDDSSAGPTVDDQIALIRSELTEYERLASELDGNPVAPLIAPPQWFTRFTTSVAARPMNEFQAARLLAEIREHKNDLQQQITDAEGRRANASGTGEEELVDSAGDGFIDIRWDADTACSTATEAGHTTAGCTSSDPVAVHILPADRSGGEKAARLTVLHELAHLYQYADLDARALGEDSAAMKLMAKGLFQDSGEVMSDCYALTYTNSYSLTFGDMVLGYGYVCDESERQAIRTWAASINAPMPG